MERKSIAFKGNHYTTYGILSLSHGESSEVVVLLHPHPLYGGDMNNPVILDLERVFTENQCNTFRFNFRGVNNTKNMFDGIKGATIDVLKASEILKDQGCSISGIVGYSFGGSTALRFATYTPLNFVITLSASLSLFLEDNYSISNLSKINSRVLMFHGDSDCVIPSTDVDIFSAEIGSSAKKIILTDENHFYNHSMIKVQDEICKFINTSKR